MKLTEHQEQLLYNHYLEREKLRYDKERSFVNGTPIPQSYGSFLYVNVKESTVEVVDKSLAGVKKFIDSIEAAPEIISVYFEEYVEQYEGQWYHESGINLVTRYLVCNKLTPERVAASDVKHFKRHYEFKTVHQPNGKDVEAYNRLLNKLEQA